jgi:rhodanese-related sulfurtransferase
MNQSRVTTARWLGVASAIWLIAGLAPACADDAATVKSVADYKAEASAAVEAISAAEAMRRAAEGSVIFIDVREGDELERLGRIENAVHVPRGVLEFYIDPASSMHKSEFDSEKTVVFYCATGGRSLLAAKLASDMGVKDPVYLEGGFRAWRKANGPLAE